MNPVQILYKQNDRIAGTSPVRTTSHLREFNAAVLRPAILRPVRHRRGKHPGARPSTVIDDSNGNSPFLNTTFPSGTTVLSNSFIEHCTMKDPSYRRKANPCPLRIGAKGHHRTGKPQEQDGKRNTPQNTMSRGHRNHSLIA